MEPLVQMLATSSGKDKALRITAYVSMILSGSLKGASAKKWGLISSNVSAARTVTRLYDDLPMLASTLKYGIGNHVSSMIFV